MHLAEKNAPHLLQKSILVILFIFLTQSIKSARSHAIDSGDSTQEIFRITYEQQRHQHQPADQQFKWLHAKSAVSPEQTQLDQPPAFKSEPVALDEEKPDQLPPTTSHSSPSREKDSQQKTSASDRQALSRGWIESILSLSNDDSLEAKTDRPGVAIIRVSKPHAEQAEQTLIESVTSPSSPSSFEVYLSSTSSEAPTDSGEDPLESQPTTSSTGLEVDEEQRLLESNNVSAIVATQNNRDEDSEQQQHSNVVVTMATRQILSCQQARSQCLLRKVCSPALAAYEDECQELIANRTGECSPRCLLAMIALRSSEEGDDLVNCDCQASEYCLQNKRQASKCRVQVERAIDPKTVVSCSIASSICMADQLCSTALDYYYRNCQTLFSQRHCSPRCNNSLAILYRQPKASKLINCQCDGSEEFPCQRYKTYTERLCLNKLQWSSTPTFEEDQENGFEGGGVQTNTGGGGLTNEQDDEQLNLTSDPSEAPLLQAGSPFATTEFGFSDLSSDLEDDQEDEQQDNSSRPAAQQRHKNGIQLEDDNYIPLVSGRYFTNLHLQQKLLMRQQEQQSQSQGQMRLQQQEQQLRQVNNQQRQRPPIRANHNKQQQQQQAARRAQTRNGTRARHRLNRPFMFALTSGAAPPPTWSLPLHLSSWSPFSFMATLFVSLAVIFIVQ